MLLAERKKILREAILNETGFSFDDLKTKSRERDLVDARHIYCFFASKHFRENLKSIGQELGGRDHTTVLSARNKILNLLDTNDPISITVKIIEKAIALPRKTEFTMKELYEIFGNDFKIIGNE